MKKLNEKKNLSCMLIEDFVTDIEYGFEEWQYRLLDKVSDRLSIGENEYSMSRQWIAQVYAIQEIAGLFRRECVLAYDDSRLGNKFRDIENVCERTVQHAKMVVETLNLYIKYDEKMARELFEYLTDSLYSQTRILSTITKDIANTQLKDEEKVRAEIVTYSRKVVDILKNEYNIDCKLSIHDYDAQIIRLYDVTSFILDADKIEYKDDKPVIRLTGSGGSDKNNTILIDVLDDPNILAEHIKQRP